MTKKRDRLEIIFSILRSIQEKGGQARPTHIMYKSNLSHQMLQDYLTELLSGKFIEEEKDKKKNKSYKLSEKGYKYMEDYTQVRNFIESYGL